MGDFGCVSHGGTGYVDGHLGQSLTEGQLYHASQLKKKGLRFTNRLFRWDYYRSEVCRRCRDFVSLLDMEGSKQCSEALG